MVDKKHFDKTLRNYSVLSLLVFMSLFFGSRLLSGRSFGIDGFFLGVFIIIALTFFVRGVLADLIVSEPDDEAKVHRRRESAVEG